MDAAFRATARKNGGAVAKSTAKSRDFKDLPRHSQGHGRDHGEAGGRLKS
jgi:hypothetical protein